MREVRCLSDDMMSSDACDQQLKPAEKEDCNPEPCIPQIGQWCSTMMTHYYYWYEVSSTIPAKEAALTSKVSTTS